MGLLYFLGFWSSNLGLHKKLGKVWLMKKIARLFGRLGRVKVLGLRAARVAQWAAVVGEEGRRVPFRAMVWEMVKGLWGSRCALRTQEAAGRRRAAYYACHRCPLFDRQRRACRPYPGAKLGCGCFMPFKVASDGDCWGRARLPGFAWGYGSLRKPIAVADDSSK